MRSLAPIISSFILDATVSGFSCDKSGNIQGYTETPYGTVTYVENTRRWHKLAQIPGDLRSFSITAEVTPRDNRLHPEPIMLAPGQTFSWQLIMLKEY